MFAKRTLLVVPLILVFCLIGCSNPSGSDDTTYFIDIYAISESCYQYLEDEKLDYAQDILAYAESQEGTEPNNYYSDDEYTIEGFQEGLRDLDFREEYISECVELLQDTGAVAFCWEGIDDTYWMLYSERVVR